jgi:hypothetical protein
VLKTQICVTRPQCVNLLDDICGSWLHEPRMDTQYGL